MKEVKVNSKMKLSEHFALGELTKTKHQTADGNIPSHAVIENLKTIWLHFAVRPHGNRRKIEFLKA